MSRVKFYLLQVKCCLLRVTCHMLSFECYMLKVKRCKLLRVIYHMLKAGCYLSRIKRPLLVPCATCWGLCVSYQYHVSPIQDCVPPTSTMCHLPKLIVIYPTISLPFIVTKLMMYYSIT